MRLGGRTVGSCGLLCGPFILAMTLAAGAGETPPRKPVIRYREDVLTVRVVKVPVSEVLAEFARQSGAEIRGQPCEAHDVTAQFDDVPLGQALYRLLGDQNYALVYGHGGRLQTVRLLGGPPGGATSTGIGSSATSKSPSPTGDLTSLAEHRVPVGERGGDPGTDILAPAVAGLQRIADFWLQGDDSPARESARSELMGIETDPESRNYAVNLASTYSDAEFAELLRQMAGSRAEQLANFIASQSRVTELRMKALSVRDILSVH
jgi:hypothetical protein